MRRRRFLAAMGAAAGAATGAERKLLLPSDVPDRYGFRIMRHNLAPPIERATYRLFVIFASRICSNRSGDSEIQARRVEAVFRETGRAEAAAAT